MKSLHFKLSGITNKEFKRLLDNAIALNDPNTAVSLVGEYIREYKVTCSEVEEYLNKSEQLHGTAFQQTPAFLIYGTHFRIKSCSRERKQLLDPDFQVNKFKIWNSDRCCSYCQKLAKVVYTKANLPELPHHAGCECMLEPIFE
jgi:thioredoxin-related protein